MTFPKKQTNTHTIFTWPYTLLAYHSHCKIMHFNTLTVVFTTSYLWWHWQPCCTHSQNWRRSDKTHETWRPEWAELLPYWKLQAYASPTSWKTNVNPQITIMNEEFNSTTYCQSAVYEHFLFTHLTQHK